MHDDDLGSIDTQNTQDLVTRAPRRGDEQRAMLHRPTQLRDALVLPRLATEWSKIIN